jgi:hypothetical protein
MERRLLITGGNLILGGTVRTSLVGKLAGALFVLGTLQIIHADNFTFNFSGLANGASDSAIQAYMNGVLSAGESVTVTGAVASQTYNGDGHVVGPVIKGVPTSYTLFNLDGTTFIKNNAPSSNDILMNFTGLNAGSYNVSFDLEIFPDGTCPELGGSNCGTPTNSNLPDLTLIANGKTINQWNAVAPPVLGYAHSPNSGGSSTELAPQLLQASGTWTIAGPLTSLEFDDWPATIGVDNLKISSVPEPAAVLLLGTLIAGLFIHKRNKQTV